MSVRDVRRQAGQLVIAGFPGPSLDADLRAVSREFELGGVILFARNVESPEQLAEVAYEAQSLRRELPLWVSVDQEGGRVARLRAPFTVWPPMSALGRSGDATLARRFARALASELRAVGVNFDYAPVLDIATSRTGTAIGDRSLGENAEDVARLGRAIIEALQEEGVAACGKHFPGHGDTPADSHHELPVVEHPPDRLDAVELVPFKAAIEADVAAVMTAHILVPALDEERPATLSRAVVSGLLKARLGFRGAVCSDDMDMQAIRATHTNAEATVAALDAGVDLVLLCGGAADAHFEAIEAVVHAVEDGTLPLARVEDALARGRRMKERFLAAPQRRPLDGRALRAVLGRDEHQAIAAEIARYV